jgi:hypothetical protein
VVRAGETTNFDPLLIRPALGVVAGTVLHNGKAASGMQVELARQDESGSDPAGAGNGRGGRGGPGGFGGFGGFGRNFQSAVAASGRFQIPSVPPGSYRLRVQAARRGGVLHEEIVTVVANATTERNLSVTTCSLQGTVTAEAGVDAKELAGRVSLLAGVTTVPENLGQWQRENPSFDARLQNGSFRFEAVKPGDYLLVVTVRGRERTTQPVVLGGDHNLTVVAGKPATAPAAPTPGGGQGNSGR